MTMTTLLLTLFWQSIDDALVVTGFAFVGVTVWKLNPDLIWGYAGVGCMAAGAAISALRRQRRQT